ADALRVQVYSDGNSDLVSIHLRGRGGTSSRIDDSATETKATLVQYLPSQGLIAPTARQPVVNKLSIYPNPATDNINMSFDVHTKVVEFRVFDLLGRLVRVVKVDSFSDEYVMPVYDLPVGTYFIKSRDIKGNEFEQRMVIVR
ncbi:MAG: T9SS type A sorting domain-containing protein, partial [Bacteroidota bacterium]